MGFRVAEEQERLKMFTNVQDIHAIKNILAIVVNILFAGCSLPNIKLA